MAKAKDNLLKRFFPSLRVMLFVTLLINLFGFYFFEIDWMLRFIMTAIVIWVFVATFIKKQAEPIIISTLYLTLFNLNNLYRGVSVPLWIVALITAIIAAGFFAATITMGLTPATHLTSLYGLLIGLGCAEIFLVLSYWPTTDATRSILTIIAFYVLWFLISSHLRNTLSRKLTWAYIIIGFIAILAIMATSSWYAFI